MSGSSRRCISSLLAAACLLSLAPRAGAQAAQTSVTRYVEARGTHETGLEYRLASDGQTLTLTSVITESQETITWITGTGTTEWRLVNANEHTDLRAQREADVVHVTGYLRNRAVSKDATFDRAPWYQLFGPLLDQLVPAGAAGQEFWVLDPADLSPHKMQVKRAGTERITINGTILDTVKFHFSPAGALAPFWGADFWYRQSDGMYVSSRLPENGGVTVTRFQGPLP